MGVLVLQVMSQVVPLQLAWPEPEVGPAHFMHPLVPHASIEVLDTQRPLQMCWPSGHAHAPSRQVWPVAHSFPQRPQLFVSDRVSTHAPEHSVRPELHLKPHVPPSHVAAAFATAVRHGVHMLPHVATSVLLTQRPPQSWVPAPHSQRPWLQLAPLGHFIPQPPQFATSARVSTQALPHAVVPSGHLNPQTPVAHVGIARATSVLQACSQVPQCDASVCRSVQLAPHKVGVFAGQPETQPIVPAHTGVPPLHTMPQLPQVAGRLRSVSQPCSGSAEQWP